MSKKQFVEVMASRLMEALIITGSRWKSEQSKEESRERLKKVISKQYDEDRKHSSRPRRATIRSGQKQNHRSTKSPQPDLSQPM